MQESMGKIIKRLRKERGFTQEELAERLGVTFQAVSKWENESGLPDISQVVPLASLFEVSTDVLFGIAGTNADEEAWEIIQKADSIREYGKPDTHLTAYDMLMEGLKKYPTNLILMHNCMWAGAALSMPDDNWAYAEDRAKEILPETIRQANFIIENSKNISDILTARLNLVFLYSINRQFDAATREARKFPVRSDLTLYSTMAIVNEYMENYSRAATYLCTDIDYSLQGLEDHIARLGKAYYNSGNYGDAIAVYETFFAIMKAIFQENDHYPYHDFDSGDCYLLLAQAYLAIGDKDRAMDAVEQSVFFYLDLCEKHTEDVIWFETLPSLPPLVKGSEIRTCLRKNILQKQLLNKLSNKEIQALRSEKRFTELLDRVNHLSF